MPLPEGDPSLPSLPTPLFSDTDAVRGDHLRALCQKIWTDLQYLYDFTGRTTDTLSEGSTNKYYTDVRAKAAAIAAALTGYAVGSNAAIAATDTILQAFGKVQAQINIGRVVQNLYQSSGASDSTSSNIPMDDSVPQDNEGKQIFSQAITPVSATSTIRIEFCLNLSQTAAGGYDVVAALFVAGSASAIYAASQSQDDNSASRFQVVGSIDIASGSTSARTYNLRYGGNDTTWVNGLNGRELGGVQLSWMRVSEIL